MLMSSKALHPVGETNSSPEPAINLDTYAGKLPIEWSPEARVTGLGQLAFFIEFLKLGGRFTPWVKDCPLEYTSNNAPSKQDVLGSLLLSVLSGHTRYSHMGALRYDSVNGELLGMKKMVSSDSARGGLQQIEEDAGCGRLQTHLQSSYLPLLEPDWILDIDVTIKPIYGHQEGAVVGYNPYKPGCPSHTYHTYLLANLRLVLDVEVLAGNESDSQHSLPGLMKTLTDLPANCRPQFVRGDCDFGNERVMKDLESINQAYLFKLRKSKYVKQLILEHHGKGEWKRFNKAWEAKSSTLQLMGWSRERRVVIVRRRLSKQTDMIALEYGQQQLAFIDGPDDLKAYEYAVLVTDLPYDETHLVQHYRDRADAENYFDEIKNQWGWCGYTTHDLKRCRFIARIIALIYNWWTLFVRCCHPDKHTEAMTSRPRLLSSVGCLMTSGRQKKLTLTNTHQEAGKIQSQLTSLGLFFKQIRATAQQLTQTGRWKLLLARAMSAFSLVGFSPPLQLTYSPG